VFDAINEVSYRFIINIVLYLTLVEEPVKVLFFHELLYLLSVIFTTCVIATGCILLDLSVLIKTAQSFVQIILILLKELLEVFVVSHG